MILTLQSGCLFHQTLSFNMIQKIKKQFAESTDQNLLLTFKIGAQIIPT